MHDLKLVLHIKYSFFFIQSHKILKHIRLNLLSPYFLYDHVESEKYIKDCNQCSSLVREALMYNLLKDRRNQIQNERTKSRKSFQHLEALVILIFFFVNKNFKLI